jgi:hypothetical protein
LFSAFQRQSIGDALIALGFQKVLVQHQPALWNRNPGKTQRAPIRKVSWGFTGVLNRGTGDGIGRIHSIAKFGFISGSPLGFD